MTTNTTNTSNVREALMAAADKKAAREQAENAAKIARKPATHESDPLAAQLAAMQAQMAQFAALLAQKDEQIAELKKSPSKKTEKGIPAPTCKNATYTYDEKTGKLTVVFDLNADIIDPETGAPKLSKSRETTGVAFFQGSFLDKNGRKVGVGCNAYHKLNGK